MEESLTCHSSPEIIGETEADIIAEDESAELSTDETVVSCRSEYEELIRTKYKQFYTEDTQRLINRRFKKYKALEARVAELEAECVQLSCRLEGEYKRGQEETEHRLVSEMKLLSSRPGENGILSRRASTSKGASGLTRSQRAELARRALMGESIKI